MGPCRTMANPVPGRSGWQSRRAAWQCIDRGMQEEGGRWFAGEIAVVDACWWPDPPCAELAVLDWSWTYLAEHRNTTPPCDAPRIKQIKNWPTGPRRRALSGVTTSAAIGQSRHAWRACM